jgi:anthranilate synthase component II
MRSVLLLDNHDSFTHNLAELLRRNGKVRFIIRTPETLLPGEAQLADKIIFSPGPGLPEEQPLMADLLRQHGNTKAFLGVCLGFQAIVIHFGGRLFNLETVVHGQGKKIHIPQPPHPLFNGIPEITEAGLYHSWAAEKESLPECLTVTAFSEEGQVMAVAHKTADICGVQFHPESVMTPFGQKMMDNWLGR